MIPYDIDPSLHGADPEQLSLDDGFSAPRSHGEAPEAREEDVADGSASLEEALAGKSDF
jgi:hypothetical protein